MNYIFFTVRVFITVFLMFGLYACSSKKYYEFTPEQLDFVAYEKGQIIKLKDTSDVVHVMEQTKYVNGYYEDTRIFTDAFIKKYEVTYKSINDPSFTFNINLLAEDDRSEGVISLVIFNYYGIDPYNKLSPLSPQLTLDGRQYSKVYRFKVVKNGEFTPPNRFGASLDTATMFFNKEYGLLQVKFPSGKSITRTD